MGKTKCTLKLMTRKRVKTHKLTKRRTDGILMLRLKSQRSLRIRKTSNQRQPVQTTRKILAPVIRVRKKIAIKGLHVNEEPTRGFRASTRKSTTTRARNG